MSIVFQEQEAEEVKTQIFCARSSTMTNVVCPVVLPLSLGLKNSISLGLFDLCEAVPVQHCRERDENCCLMKRG